MATQYYVLFPDHTTGMELYHLLKNAGIRAIIAPTPRSLSKCCGISLLIEEWDLDTIRSVIKRNELEIVDIAAL